MAKNYKKSFNLILLGDPASGKGTQAARLVKKYHLYDFDMGREVRKPAVRKQFDYKGTTAMGKLTPTTVVRNIFKRVIAHVPAGQGILFNGTPKMIGEAKLVASLLKKNGRENPLVIYLHIPIAEVIRRAAARKIYIDGKLQRREDDSARALKNREKYYKEQVVQAVAFFNKAYTLRKVSGSGSEKEVAQRIKKIILTWKHDA